MRSLIFPICSQNILCGFKPDVPEQKHRRGDRAAAGPHLFCVQRSTACFPTAGSGPRLEHTLHVSGTCEEIFVPQAVLHSRWGKVSTVLNKAESSNKVSGGVFQHCKVSFVEMTSGGRDQSPSLTIRIQTVTQVFDNFIHSSFFKSFF